MDYSKYVKKLSFVFMYPLHLNIKHCIQTDLKLRKISEKITFIVVMKKKRKVQVNLCHFNLHTTHCFNVFSKPHFIDPFNLQYQKDRKRYKADHIAYWILIPCKVRRNRENKRKCTKG